MNPRGKSSADGAMLELWRPPQQAGDPLGCLATTYTFAPGMFDEQCLARFLEIESEPNREDLAFLLERESRLGSVYAGVLVDHSQAGVEHSLRWDVLPVRLQAGKQHAKLTLLAWTHHIRVIVASANLSEPGYRTNREVAASVDFTPYAGQADVLSDSIAFLRSLLRLVPGASADVPVVQRAEAFLQQVERRVRGWQPARRKGSVRRSLVCTLPSAPGGRPARSSLEESLAICRRRGNAPELAWIASPFFDADEEPSRVAAALCKAMTRDFEREIWLALPAVREPGARRAPRLQAPKALFVTPLAYDTSVHVEMLPNCDEDRNQRVWHAKMLALFSKQYSALMIGSSNFTCAGMGVGAYRNAEANLVTIVDLVEYGREAGELKAVWPEMEEVLDPNSAEWLGRSAGDEEDDQAQAQSVPAGFLCATYRAGEPREIVLRLDAPRLPEQWHVRSCGRVERELLTRSSWLKLGEQEVVTLPWDPPEPPEKLLVRWGDHQAFLPVNVEDGSRLPRPSQLEHMSADDMLWILAAADPSAAFRSWARRRTPPDDFDPDIDSATPVDLDPLHRHDLESTFLHVIRRRARVLAQLRANLQRPVWGPQALEWRLRGLVGVEPLADRLASEVAAADGTPDEALLTLADFLIVLREVDYQPADGSLPKTEFERVFGAFLLELVDKLEGLIGPHRGRLSGDMLGFWNRVVARCRA